MATNVDPQRFPRLAAYLDRLPHGVDSYPEHVARAAMYLDALDDRPLILADGELPDALMTLVRSPVDAQAWIPEVHMNAIFYAVADEHFSDVPVDDFIDWTYGRNLHLLDQAWFRVLFAVARPQWILRGIEKRWSQFRRGTELRMTERESGRVRVRLIYRPNLHDADSVRCIGAALRAAAAIAGADNVVEDVVRCDEVHTDFLYTWV